MADLKGGIYGCFLVSLSIYNSNIDFNNCLHLKMVSIKNTVISKEVGGENLAQYIRVLLKEPACELFQVATGYWDLPGMLLIYDELNDFLKRGGKVQILIGQEPTVREYQLEKGQSFNPKFPDFHIKRDIDKLGDEYRKVAQLLLDYMEEDEDDSQIIVRIFGRKRNSFLHAKAYVFSGLGFGCGIIGSSNFTRGGLESNSELNYLESETIKVTSSFDKHVGQYSHKAWFDFMWESDTTPWTGRFVKDILLETNLGKKLKSKQKKESEKEVNLTPYEIYIRYLHEHFGNVANAEERTLLMSYLPNSYQPLDFQLDAVQQCYNIMRMHGGFILADVVGLGKTVVGVLLIKKFLSEAYYLERVPRVLIITPPSIKSNWIRTIEEFDSDKTFQIEDKVDFISTGSISKLLPDELGPLFDPDLNNEDDFEIKTTQNYGLIMIDESHGFRNSRTQKYQDLTQLIGDIEQRTGYAPYVGLLSATPQNNRPDDLKNQIFLFQRNPNNSTLCTVDGNRLDSFMSEKQKEFEIYRKDNSPEGRKELQKIAEEIRNKVLNQLLVRRTRTSVQKYYPEDTKRLNFPEVQPPHKLEYKLDKELSALFARTIDAIAYGSEEAYNSEKHIGFFRYSAIKFLKSEEHRALYEIKNLTVESISSRLATIMRILLVKRLESSIHAFKESLLNLKDYTSYMLEMLEEDTVYICPDIEINDEIRKHHGVKSARHVIEARMKELGGNNRRFRAQDFSDEYKSSLEKDLKIIGKLWDDWSMILNNPKQEKFRDSLREVLFDPQINNPSGKDQPKLVIFTEAIATLNSVTSVAESMGYSVLKVGSENRKVLEPIIRENFDANLPSEDQKNDYDIIVTTEVLAEGVNLHRTNVVLNYDTPWNSTRLMQRIGRVNRIGSTEKEIHVYNFYPTAQGNEQIKLVELAFNKLQAFHTMFGEDNQVFSNEEELFDIEFLMDIEDVDSPLSPYISELKEYQKENPERFEQIIAIQDSGSLSGRVANNTVKKEQRALVMVRMGGRPYTTMLSDFYGKFQQPTPLEAIAFLKCSKDEKFVTKKEDLASIQKEAIDTYKSKLKSLKGAKDIKGTKIRKALKILNSVAVKEQIRGDEEAVEIFDGLQKTLKANNNYVADLIINVEKEIKHMDFAKWLKTTFGTILKTKKKAKIQDIEVLITVLK